MKVLIASAEAVPFAKVGGLADVVGSLPKALRQEGIDARVIIPGYGFISHDEYDIAHLFSFQFQHYKGISTVDIYSCIYESVPFYFVQVWPYIGTEESVYTTWEWDVPRFILFNQIVMASAWQLKVQLNWFPNIVHANDWHTGLLPFLISENRWNKDWSGVGTVTTIHNIAYQGDHVGGFLFESGIPTRFHPELTYLGLNDNMLAIATVYADMITTVSPRYAKEIQYSFAGYELAPLIQLRKEDVKGILNGIDVEIWDPRRSEDLENRYDVNSFINKRALNKVALQKRLGLAEGVDIPIIGIVSRLVKQKGFAVALPALDQILHQYGVQLIVLGTGEDWIEDGFRQLAERYPDRARALLYFNETDAHQIYASSDLFLMPSNFEPCGIGQMIAMHYGSLPLVRSTGGLADTVINFDNADGTHGTGFVYQEQSSEAILGTLKWALETYHQKRAAWQQMQRNGMTHDFSWRKSAKEYVSIYHKISSYLKQEREN